jgi:HD-GYP domain-containing protein (c-di-GMP phosphodiesterase class II)
LELQPLSCYQVNLVDTIQLFAYIHINQKLIQSESNLQAALMALLTSLHGVKAKKIFLSFFALSSLFPILIAIFIVNNYVVPIVGKAADTLLDNVFYLGLSAMLFFPLISFFLMYRWLNTLESVTAEIMSISEAVAKREGEFGTQHIAEDHELAAPIAEHHPEENEVQTLIRSFNTIFQTAADQLAERNHLRELLARLIGIASTLTAELDFDRLFPLVVGNVTEAMLAERTSMYVVDWEHRELWTKVSEGVKPIRLPLGQGISGRVAETGEMLNVVDAWELPYFDRSFDLSNDFRTRSVLCMPIKNRSGETIGVLQVINKKGKDRFDEEDESFMKGLTSQIAIALENSILVDEILLSFNSSMRTLSAIVDARHHFTAGHSDRVKEYSLLIAAEISLTKEGLEPLEYAALLHDIGKIGIRDDVLMKAGAFTPEDWVEMKAHPVKTKTILDNFHFPRHLSQVSEIACRHHERMDGTGYPDGLTGDQITLGSRIIAVADVFDALTSRRDYPKYAFGQTMDSEPMPLNRVIDILREDAGSHFDPLVVDAFIKSLPHALIRYRGEHFTPEYVDETLRTLNPELLSKKRLPSQRKNK